MNLIDNPDQAKRLAEPFSPTWPCTTRKRSRTASKTTIFLTFSRELEEGRQHFLSRVSTDINPEDIYGTAVVDVLIKRAGKIDLPSGNEPPYVLFLQGVPSSVRLCFL
jgi:hypothetical protein